MSSNNNNSGLFDRQLKVITIGDGARYTGTVNSIEDCEKLSKLENQYFVVGETDVTKKPNKTDMHGSYWAWVDIDLGMSGSYKDKRLELCDYIEEHEWDTIPRPTVLIDSGGGFQLFWRMMSLMDNETTENVNRWLIQEMSVPDRVSFNPDRACINIDRVMRLPGTYNVPTLKKISEKGYPEAGAITQIIWDDDLSYNVSQFEQIEHIVPKPRSMLGANLEDATLSDFDISTKEMKRIDFKYCSRIMPKHWINYITNHIIPTKDEWAPHDGYTGGESEYIRGAMIILASRGMTQKEVTFMAVATCYKWSKWWLAKCRTPEDLLARIIKEYDAALVIANKNKDEELNGELSNMNEVYAVLDDGINYNIIREDLPGKPHVITHRDTWMHATGHIKAKNHDGKVVAVNRLWLTWPGQRKYNYMVFNATKSYEYELWHGWGVSVPDTCDPIIDEAMNTFFNNLLTEVDQREFFLNIIAYSVQNIGKMTGRMPILFGQKGCGKSFVGSMIHYMFYDYAIKTNVEQSLRRFTGHLENKLCVFFDELTYIDADAGSKLKDMVTSPTINIEDKGMKSKNAKNYGLYIATADDAKFVYGEKGERRTFAVECSNHYNIKFDDSAKRMDEFAKVMGIMGKHPDDWTHMGDIIAWFKNRVIPSDFGLETQINSEIIDDNVIKKLPVLYRFWFDIFQANKMPTMIKHQQSQSEDGKNYVTAHMIINHIKEAYDKQVEKREVSKFMKNVLGLEQKLKGTNRLRWLIPDDMRELHRDYNINGGPRIDEDCIG